MFIRPVLAAICLTVFLSVQVQAQETPATDIFAQSNRVAWCVVPFDKAQRTPEQRAEMLKRLKFTKLAYDWRANHVTEFEDEIIQLKKHGIELFAFWSNHDEAFRLFRKHKISPQIWKTCPSSKAASQQERVAMAAKQLLPLVEQCQKRGCKLGLYNHGGWGGEPDNMVAVCEYLREQHDAKHVGIVYNLHHGHGHTAEFREHLKALSPYLLCLNLNGMNDKPEPKILPIGQGKHDERLVRIILESKYRGPIGILDHRNELDAEESLQQNLNGLDRLVKQIRQN